LLLSRVMPRIIMTIPPRTPTARMNIATMSSIKENPALLLCLLCFRLCITLPYCQHAEYPHVAAPPVVLVNRQLLTLPAGVTVIASQPPNRLFWTNHSNPEVTLGQTAGLRVFAMQGRPRALKPILTATCGDAPPT